MLIKTLFFVLIVKILNFNKHNKLLFDLSILIHKLRCCFGTFFEIDINICQ